MSSTTSTQAPFPILLIFYLDTTTRDRANWKVLQWYYNGIFYDSIEDFRAAWKSTGFQKAAPNLDGDWTDLEDFGPGLPGRHKPPPLMIQPYGARYNIDEAQKFVSWSGFNFYITTSQVTGLRLFDLRFHGERVFYELGLEEALVHYSGDDPFIGGLEFLDSFGGLGSSMFELVPGYDCPAYATFLSSSYHHSESTFMNKNSICIFEYTADYPLSRHTSDSYVSISRNTYLVVRSVSTMGNYDYTVDYIFYLDGTIEVKVRASGFIFSDFWTSNRTNLEGSYGYRIHDAAATSMHDHVFGFKADLDIAGTENTLVRVGIEPAQLTYPWDSEATTPRSTMHLVRHPVTEEVGLTWPQNSGELYVVLNNDSTNAWGEKRGYRVMPGTGIGNPSHLTIKNSTALGKSAEWASKDLWVLKRKDTEPRSASPLNALDEMNPLIDFSKFVDGENITQEDL